jgi:hypothetical protein
LNRFVVDYRGPEEISPEKSSRFCSQQQFWSERELPFVEMVSNCAVRPA